MKMHVLSGGRLRMKQHIFTPDADRDLYTELPVSCFLLRHGQGNVLFDTGCHPDAGTSPQERWGGLAKAMIPIFSPQETLIAHLGTTGLTPNDIDVVINSHLHADHCGCNEFFKKATFFVHSKELNSAQDPRLEGQGYFRADWDHPMPMEIVDGEHDLFGDDRLVLLPLPGHTPGMMGAIANLDKSGSFLLASDAVNMRITLDQDIAPKNTWNAELLHKSFAEIRKIEKAGTTVLCGHDSAQWATLKKGAEAYE